MSNSSGQNPKPDGTAESLKYVAWIVMAVVVLGLAAIGYQISVNISKGTINTEPVNKPSEQKASISNPPTTSPNQASSTSQELAGCEKQLLSRFGRYDGKSTVGSSGKSGDILINLSSNKSESACGVQAQLEEFLPLRGEGTLTGKFDEKDEMVRLRGRLKHQTEHTFWDVEMTFKLVGQNQIEGESI